MSKVTGNSDDSCTSNATKRKPCNKDFAIAAESGQRKNPVNNNKTPVTTMSNCLDCKAKQFF